MGVVLKQRKLMTTATSLNSISQDVAFETRISQRGAWSLTSVPALSPTRASIQSGSAVPSVSDSVLSNHLALFSLFTPKDISSAGDKKINSQLASG